MAINVTSLWVGLLPEADNPAQNLYGVRCKIYITGSGEGRIRVDWGNYESEYFDVAPWALQIGANNIGNSLPIGTHNICVSVV